MVHPIVRGAGLRIVGENNDAEQLRFKTADTASDGMTVLVYESAG